MRSLRSRLSDTRLAVTLAMQPFGEAQPRVGDVDATASAPARPTASTDAQRRRHHAEDHVEVVDHQIEDDVDVGAALGERREAVALDEARLR